MRAGPDVNASAIAVRGDHFALNRTLVPRQVTALPVQASTDRPIRAADSRQPEYWALFDETDRAMGRMRADLQP